MAIKKDAFGRYVIECSPNSNLDYGITWYDWLELNEQLVSSSWTISGNGAVSNQSFNPTGLAITFALTPTVKTEYTLTNSVTTNQGRSDSRSVILQCIQR